MTEYCCSTKTLPEPCSDCRRKMVDQLGNIIFDSVFLFLDVSKLREPNLVDFMFGVTKKNKDIDAYRTKFALSLPPRYRK